MTQKGVHYFTLYLFELRTEKRLNKGWQISCYLLRPWWIIRICVWHSIHRNPSPGTRRCTCHDKLSTGNSRHVST